MPDSKLTTAKELMDEIAKDPSLDTFFERVPVPDRKQLEAMLRKLRDERATWGYNKE